MPTDGARQEEGFLLQFLLVIFAEVDVGGGRGVEGEDVGCGLELGDGDQADLGVGVRQGSGRWGEVREDKRCGSACLCFGWLG